MPAISADLRERVLRAIQNGEPTSQIARRFEVSPAWVRRFHQRFRETGETTPRVPQSTRVPKLQPHLDTIRNLLAKTPDMALHELRHELAISVALSTLWLAVKQLGLTFKKKSSTPPSKTARTLPPPANSGVRSSYRNSTSGGSSSSMKPSPTPSKPGGTVTHREANPASIPFRTDTTNP